MAASEDLNLRSLEGSYTLCTDGHWIQVAVIGLLVTKNFLKVGLMLLFIYSICNSASHYLHCFSRRVNSVITVA